MTDSLSRRDVLRGALGAAAVGAVSQAAEADEPSPHQAPSDGGPPWYRSLLVGIEWGPTGANDHDAVYMSKATGKQIIDHMVQARAEYAVVFMKDFAFAYYPSRVARRCPALGERDLLQECIDAAKPHGMPVVAYCQVQYDTRTYDEHPEWRMKDHTGKDVPGRLCYTSGYLEFIKKVAAEMMAYDIQGFHVDMLDFGFGEPYGCWCPTCRTLFKKRYGVAMPDGVTWDETWDKMLTFRCNSNAAFCRELDAFVKSHRPKLSVDFNYHGYPPFNWVEGQRPGQHAQNGDFVTAEGLPFKFGHYNPSLLTRFMFGARPDGNVQSVTSRSVFDYHDVTVRPTADLSWEVFTYLSHGAQCTIVDKADYDGRLDPTVYDRIGEIFSEARDKRATFGHPPIQDVGLYYSSRSRDWYGRSEPATYMRGFWGAHKALVQLHIPFGILTDDTVTADRLAQFPVVYVPNATILSDLEIERLTAYVEAGGRLLLTGLTGLCDARGALLKDPPFAHLIGARLERVLTGHDDNYVRLPSGPKDSELARLADGLPTNVPILTWGPIAIMKPADAMAYGQLMVAHRTKDNPWTWRMSADKAVGPAVLLRKLGKGQVMTLPCSPDAAYAGDYRMPEHRILLGNCVKVLRPKPAVTVQAPLNVESIMTREEKRRRIYIHLVAFFGPPTHAAEPFPQGNRVLPALMEEPGLYDAQITCRYDVHKVRAHHADTQIRRQGRRIGVRVARPHEVVMLDV